MRTFVLVLSVGCFAYAVATTTLIIQKAVGKERGCNVEVVK